ncbi:AraC family transcriptional regulator, partial [Stutzerimonas kunmingensis]|uniref:AraC family transcriptional regulator n=3 Tax=Stutzerimonas stutzeri subgroup TaxID=578833 RepID=UPI0028A25809
MTERTTSSSWALGIVQALESAGIDCRQLFIELHLDYAALSDPDARFAQDDMTRLWQSAVVVSGDPAIGLNMARQARPAALNVVGYALMSSRNLKEGFARLVRYQRIIAEGADLDFQPCAQGYRLSLTIIGDRLPPARQSAEGSLAGCLTFCRWLTGTPLLPLEVSFQGRPPDDLEPYRQLFQA